jgi:hypothetical protein
VTLIATPCYLIDEMFGKVLLPIMLVGSGLLQADQEKLRKVLSRHEVRTESDHVP